MRDVEDGEIEEFLGLSSRLTGFGPDELREGAPAAELLAVLLEQVGAHTYRRLVAEPDAPDAGIRAAAEVLIHLWYTGSRSASPGGGEPFVVSPRAHAGALVWRAVGVPAPGTSAPGFGSWSRPTHVGGSATEPRR
ncbi:hypothetical protein [Streptomyces sp. NPDC059564]|uniref:hypothetical protein n=1 Tax=Streptomyces sp. NPDC059564 TaxID=3346865 RepID=UPI0036C3BA18